jgi:outer membrane receptor protein involved in Fe transport
MREFYLETIPKSWEPNGFLGLSGNANINSNLIIPNQHLLNGGFTYNPSYRGFTIGAEVRNILNKNLYDYYRIQRAGRSFYLKLSYQIP